MEYVIGVDIGGTCTDCVVMDQQGQITIAKAFSTPQDFSAGILDALEVAAHQLGIDTRTLLSRTKLFLHGTTIAENAIVDGKLVTAGILVTRGFEDTLSLMRGAYAQWSGRTEEEMKNIVYARRPAPLIPVWLIAGVKERTDASGEVIAAADEAEVARAVRTLLERGAEALGVAFLWSFMNPQNEITAKKVIGDLAPGLFCTVSHEIAPIMGEFERMQTVALNIRLGPAISTYLKTLEEKLDGHGLHGALLIMQAHGGLLGVEEASARPVGMIESGP